MPITTKSGDKGVTGVTGKRVGKDSQLIEAIGELDELMAVIALVMHKNQLTKVSDRINSDLYYLSAYLAGYGKEITLEESLCQMEEDIKRTESEMESVEKFLKAGGQLNIDLNWARTVARRCERRMVALAKIKKLDPVVLKYMNRLSSYLFTLGRAVK
ncbi:MAG: cob(I)yrinic acid a,c-diamide adenosyltransferase [Candidatus Shapirobacteria bacterium]|jgi:ATP:cob(I)alamin adenosyltransferase